MSKFQNDFVKEEIIEFEIEGRVFGYIPVTAGDENDWLPLYTYIDEEGKIKQNYDILNKLKVASKLVKVPYDKEDIKSIIGLEKEWKDLTIDEKWSLLRKLRPSLFDSLIKKINEINSGSLKKKI